MSSILKDHLRITGCADTDGDAKILSFVIFVLCNYDTIEEKGRLIHKKIREELPEFMQDNYIVSVPMLYNTTTVEKNDLYSTYDSRLMIDVQIIFDDNAMMNKFKLASPDVYELWRDYL